ncbi:MAG: hypothetical protein JWN28_590 [Candidatus Saccharibacteria bacterium]|nr:hypothetical protein [Candidatus Saccharibacteria bacterium]
MFDLILQKCYYNIDHLDQVVSTEFLKRSFCEKAHHCHDHHGSRICDWTACGSDRSSVDRLQLDRCRNHDRCHRRGHGIHRLRDRRHQHDPHRKKPFEDAQLGLHSNTPRLER